MFKFTAFLAIACICSINCFPGINQFDSILDEAWFKFKATYNKQHSGHIETIRF
jgi:hypothetical protein